MRKDVELADGENEYKNLSVREGALRTDMERIKQLTEKLCLMSVERR